MKKLRSLAIAFLALPTILLLGACSDTDDREILFIANSDGDNEVYAIRSDGTGLKQLTDNTTDESAPSWSPNGEKIVFVSNRDGNNEIYVMDSDGGNPVNLTNHPSGDYLPEWSPDGTKISFGSLRAGAGDIFVMSADGGNVINVSDSPGQDEGAKQWAPDSSRIVFEHFPAPRQGEIVVVNADGSGLTNLTETPKIRDFSPNWSPDGTKIVFSTNEHHYWDISIINADASGEPELFVHEANDSQPRWSPIGDSILFTTTRDGTRQEVYKMLADGSGAINISNSIDDEDYQQIWSPDGTRIALIRFVDGTNNVFVMDADGSNQEQLTTGANASQLSWRATIPAN